MPRSHITECGPQNCTVKYTRQWTYLPPLPLYDCRGDRQEEQSGAEQGSKGAREGEGKKNKERSVITTRCAASIRSVTAPLLILNTELFPPGINLTGIWFRRWMKSSRRIAGTRSLMRWIYLKRHVIWKHTGGKLQGIWGRAWRQVVRGKGSSATATTATKIVVFFFFFFKWGLERLEAVSDLWRWCTWIWSHLRGQHPPAKGRDFCLTKT